ERAGAPTKELGAEPVSQVPWDVAQGGGPVACLKFQKISQDSRRLRAGIRVAHGTRPHSRRRPWMEFTRFGGQLLSGSCRDCLTSHQLGGGVSSLPRLRAPGGRLPRATLPFLRAFALGGAELQTPQGL